MFIGSYEKWVFLAVAVFAIACGPASGQDTQPSGVGDRAGVVIVENTVHDWGERVPWTISDPLLTIGAAGGAEEYQFFDVTGAALLNSRIIVANAGTYQLRSYDLEGRHLGTSGGQGGGPGEFSQMGTMFRYRGDSLLVAANGGNRFSVFSADGNFVRSGVIRQNNADLPFAVLKGSTGDGRLLVQTFDPMGGAVNHTNGVVTTTAELFFFDPVGAYGISIGEFIGFRMFRGDTPMAFGPVPFGISSYQVGFGDRVYVGESEKYEIRVFDTRGVLKSIIRQSHQPVPVSALHKNQNIEERRSELENLPAVIRSAQETLLDEIPFPEFFPAFKGFQIDAEGNLWVRDYPLPGNPGRRYMVFNATGNLLGPIDFPPSFTPLEIGADYVLGRYRDADDVEYIRLYELRK